MDWLKNLLKALFPEKAEAIDKNFPDNIPDADPKPKPDADNPLDAQMQQLTATLHALEEKLQGYEEKISKLTNVQKRTHKEKVEQVLQKAIEDHRLPGKNEELLQHYRKILENDFEAGVKIIENIPQNTTEPAPGAPPARRILSPLDGTSGSVLEKIKEYSKSAAPAAGDE